MPGLRSALVSQPGAPPVEGELRLLLRAGKGGDQRFRLESSVEAGATMLRLEGAGEQALLYAVFELLERQGACFSLDGERYPLDPPESLWLPEPGQPWHGAPRFATRGMLPWPDFLNGVTVYNREDYRAYLEALLRMRANLVALHVYAGGGLVEPMLDIEYDRIGHAAYLDSTATGRWGWLPQRTSRLTMGAADYFDAEVFGAEAARRATSPWEAAEYAQAALREAFAYARQLGMQTGIGFEPSQLPDEIMRASPPEARSVFSYAVNGATQRFSRLNPESRAARSILETRLNRLLESYPHVDYIYLWEDEAMSWASQQADVPLSLAPFKQAHAFLRRHAPEKRLVLAGWGGVARAFPAFHRLLPDDVIFSCLSDQLGWDALHEHFGQLEGRERWPVLWVEDDASMWFPQWRASRIAADMALAEQYGCQGICGIHWRQRIIEPVAGYLGGRAWDETLTIERHYQRYGRTQAAGTRGEALGQLLAEVDQQRLLLSSWSGALRPDGHAALQEYAGDYGDAFLYRLDDWPAITAEQVEAQQAVAERMARLLQAARGPAERERLGYLYGQTAFVAPYARAWRCGAQLQRLLAQQQAARQQGAAEEAARIVREQGVPLWLELLGHVRAAVLAFQRTIATRNDLGTLASIHNKFVRLATMRTRASLLEFLGELPAQAEEAWRETHARDEDQPAGVVVLTRPTRLAPAETLTISAIATGPADPLKLVFCWRPLGGSSWRRQSMRLRARRTYAHELRLPAGAPEGLEYYVEASFAGARVTAPPEGKAAPYMVSG